jgi:hypothetical protein
MDRHAAAVAGGRLFVGRSLKITVDGRTLELSAATAQQQQQLVTEFIRSLGAPGEPDTI